jgi:hypothetical protein
MRLEMIAADADAAVISEVFRSCISLSPPRRRPSPLEVVEE